MDVLKAHPFFEGIDWENLRRAQASNLAAALSRGCFCWYWKGCVWDPLSGNPETDA
jgi:hypothetical protein